MRPQLSKVRGSVQYLVDTIVMDTRRQLKTGSPRTYVN
jgi:hypothetical protein